MESLLVGNGVTIQFGGPPYTNEKIIKRARNNINIKKFPCDVYPHEILQYLQSISEIIPAMLNGEYDQFVYTEATRKSLGHFKNRYKALKKNYVLHDIGLEDYFTVHLFFCYKHKIQNPDQYTFRECLRMLFLDSIYNFGKIQILYEKYPTMFVGYLMSFNNIFTTNYDWNLEKATGKEVGYLHGCFHQLEDVYDPNSLRNQMDDSPIKTQNLVTPKGYEYLHSTALMASSGEDKAFIIDMPKKSNSGIEKMAKYCNEIGKPISEFETWKNSDQQCVRNLYQAINLKMQNEDLKSTEYQAFELLKQINDNLTIIGLSPYNDNHIFSNLNSNDKIQKVTYYYYCIDEANAIRVLLDRKKVTCFPVIDFWASMI